MVLLQLTSFLTDLRHTLYVSTVQVPSCLLHAHRCLQDSLWVLSLLDHTQGPHCSLPALWGQIPPFSAVAQFRTHVSSSTVPGSSVTLPIASAPPLHFGVGGTLSSPDTGYAGTSLSPSPAPDSVEATMASWSDFIFAYPGSSGGFSSGGQ